MYLLAEIHTPGTAFPGNVFFLLIFFGALAFFGYSVWARLLKPMLQARREDRLYSLRSIAKRTAELIPLVLGNARVARPRYWYSGILHTMIFWGFVVLQLRTLNFILEGFDEGIAIQAWGDPVYQWLRPVMDLFNLLVIVGVGMAAFQRFALRPPRLTLNWDAWAILFLIAALMVSDVMVNAAQIALYQPDWAEWSFLANAVAPAIEGWDRGALEAFHTGSWFAHLLVFTGFLCFLPFSKHSHIFTVPFNVLFKRDENYAYLRKLDLDAPLAEPEPGKEDELPAFGVGKWQDFSWKNILDFYTCTECGRCEVNCPAFLTGKDLSPKAIEHNARMHVTHEVDAPLIPLALKKGPGTTGSADAHGAPGETLIEAEGFNSIWDCVTCGACMEQCPVMIEHIPEIIDMRRFLVMDEARMPETAQATLANLEQRGHPWRGTAHTRTGWMEGMDVPTFDGSQDYLYWVGCTGALADRNIPITKAMASLLQHAGVSFGVLGDLEICSGDPARRMGNEYVAQAQIQQNIETFKQAGAKKVLTNCPHCFNIMKNEYPDFGGEFEVIHHTEFFNDLVKEGALRPKKSLGRGKYGDQYTVTYHDPCYMGRHNDSFEAPRELIGNMGARVSEMEWNRRKAFCCGAGGGHMWVEETKGKRINHARTEHAYATDADTIATGCPFCIQMFEDGIPTVQPDEEKRMKAFDIVELLEVTSGAGIANPAAAEPPTPGAGQPAHPVEAAPDAKEM
ncbi:MAG: 4Fe-4S dicluster domain-containing protein [Dehalococcoidia bacterium]|nr:4Fe-4S dicluster domain-containing protein [Dehalococcoidia bacterium]